ncbi:hypothetical protein GCM10022226_46840 [Sphaerisporangium flaviroseum]|uniref:Uncharacterized protein n=1 Tax=Sphaerisporangium flaviroseum TaxID=509199 RepID=A0ABP7IL20_9ACTN
MRRTPAASPADRPPHLTRTQACALLLEAPGGRPPRTVLVVDGDGTVHTATPDAFWVGGRGRAVLTRAELVDAGVRVVPGSGGRLSAGSGPRLDGVLAELNAHLAATWHCSAGGPA